MVSIFLFQSLFYLFYYQSIMGINSAGTISYNIKNLSVKDIKCIIEKLRHQSCDEQYFKVDVNCNWLVFCLGGSKKSQEAATLTCDFLQ